jgi:hypothetical protein
MHNARYVDYLAMGDWKSLAEPILITSFWLIVFTFACRYYQNGEQERISAESLRTAVESLQDEVNELKGKLEDSSEVLSNVLQTSYNISNAFFEQKARLKVLKTDLASNLFAVQVDHVKASVAEHLQNLRGRIMYLENQLDA